MTKPDPFKYFKTSREIIRLAVMMYVRFPLSLRNVEDLLDERGIDISHESVRFWVSLRWRPSDGISTPVISPTLWPTISSDPRLKSFLPRMARVGGTGAKLTRFGLWKRAFGDTGKYRRRPVGMVCRALC